MNRALLTAASLAFAAVLVCGANVQADNKTNANGAPTNTGNGTKQTTQKIGKAKTKAVFHLRDFRGFTSYCYLPRYRCYAYFSPADGLWFYWYQPSARFLPTAYLAYYPPVLPGLAQGTPPLPGTTTGAP